MSNTHQPKAFPKGADFGSSVPCLQDGMDLRDYFAAKAMQALIANHYDSPEEYPKIAENAYSIADAMMERRRK